VWSGKKSGLEEAMKDVPTKILVAVLTLPTLATPAIATNQGTLPDGAIPLTPAETAAVYVGRTTYDAPDAVVRNTWKAGGKALATWEGKNGQVSPAEGTWAFPETSSVGMWTFTAQTPVSRSITTPSGDNRGKQVRRGG
jgi:hypothetical protein